MQLPMYQVDAFSDRVFGGNPAAVCPLESWLPTEHMQAIAAENNLAETAFLVGGDGRYEIRWFTPELEVDLCGHATLASAHVLWTELGERALELEFQSHSGPLHVTQGSGRIHLNFPTETAKPVDLPSALQQALGTDLLECRFNQDYLVLVENELQLSRLKPDFRMLGGLKTRGVIVTSPSDQYDFVCRFFAPAVGIDEDPVTGSAFTKLIPYWADRLQKKTMTARQISPRGGDVWCELMDGRVRISGYASTYLRGIINV